MPHILRTDDGQPLIERYVGPTPVGLMVDPAPSSTAAMTVPFLAVEVEAFQPSFGSLTPIYSWGQVPWGMLSLSAVSAAATIKIRASDVGYRTLASDPDGVQPYPPIVTEAFQLNRQAPIDFGTPTSDVSWGSVSLANYYGQFDDIAGSMTCDGRAVSILRGRKQFNDERGIFSDPSYTDLAQMFAGVAKSWFLDSTVLRVPMRDASYWLEKVYQQAQYGGTGNYEGDASLAGTPKPRTRGGTSGHPIRRVNPVRISTSPIVFQFSDGPGTVVKVYEGAGDVFTDDGDVADLFAGGAPASGHYRTDNANSAFQLGSEPVGEITCDVTGAFQVAGAISVLPTIALYIMTEDMLLPSQFIDSTGFATAATDFPYTGGIYFGPDDKIDGATAVFRVLSSMAARCVGGRNGKLTFFALRALDGMETPVLTVSLQNCRQLTPVPMIATLDPPPYRVRLAYNHNNTVSSGPYDGLATGAEKLFAQQADHFTQFTDGVIGLRYAQPNDLAPFGGAMLIKSEAQTVTNAVGALLCARLRLYDAQIPIDVALDADLVGGINQVVKVLYPLDDLLGGKLGQIVGETFNSSDPFVTLRILITG